MFVDKRLVFLSPFAFLCQGMGSGDTFFIAIHFSTSASAYTNMEFKATDFYTDYKFEENLLFGIETSLKYMLFDIRFLRKTVFNA